jgi:hypothetical protein
MNIVPENSKNMKVNGVSLEDLSQRDDYFIVDAYSWNNVYKKWFNELNFPELTAINKDENGKITSQTRVTGVFKPVHNFGNNGVLVQKVSDTNKLDEDKVTAPNKEEDIKEEDITGHPSGYNSSVELQRRLGEVARMGRGGGINQGGKRLAAKKPTSKRVMIDGKNRTVYVGPKGGEYIKKDGKFVSI